MSSDQMRIMNVYVPTYLSTAIGMATLVANENGDRVHVSRSRIVRRLLLDFCKAHPDHRVRDALRATVAPDTAQDI